MKVAVLSDLHIKYTDGSKKFIFSDSEFLEYLKELLTRVDFLILDGDVLELWKPLGLTFKSQILEYEKIVDEYPSTLAFIFDDPRVKLIYGNHDDAIPKMSKFYSPLRKFKYDEYLFCSQGEIKIWHGHLDFWNSKLPKIGFFLTWCSGIIERVLFKKANHYKGFAKFFKKPFFKNSTQIKDFKDCIDSDDNLVVMINGHTHHSEILRFEYNNKERLYINCGYFNGINKDIVILDTDTLDVYSETIRETNFYGLKKKVLPGDIILTYNTENPVSTAITAISESDYSHSLVYLGNGLIIESTLGEYDGVHIGSINKYLQGKHNIEILRLKDQSIVPLFIKNLESFLGLKYSKIQLAVFAGYFLLKKFGIHIKRNIDIEENQMVCFELVAEALTKSGINIPSDKAISKSFQERSDIFDKVVLLNTSN